MFFCKKDSIFRFLASVLLFAVVFCVFGLMLSSTDEPAESVFEADKKKIIIIDAGHGGQDGGAVGPDGTLEKDLNLDIVLKMRSYLLLLGYSPVLTRETDDDTDGDGTDFSKKQDILNRKQLSDRYPDAPFISVHINLSTSSRDKGFTVFYGVQNAKSKEMAKTVWEYADRSGLCNRLRDVVAAPTSVYLQQKITAPCLLVECGFISNEEDLACLKDEAYREKLAFMLVCAITATQ